MNETAAWILDQILVLGIPLVIALTLGSAARGYVARYFGDDTAERAGRVTLNPLKHIDLIGTVLLPAILILSKAGFVFGYAKQVPIDPLRLQDPRHDMMWIAASGPGMSFILAGLSVLFLAITVYADGPLWLARLLWGSTEINLVLMVVSLWPIPPLDGSRILAGLLPPKLAIAFDRLEPFGILILLGIFVVLPSLGFNVLQWMVGRPVQFLERPILYWLRTFE